MIKSVENAILGFMLAGIGLLSLKVCVSIISGADTLIAAVLGV